MFLAEVTATDGEKTYTRLETHTSVAEAEDWIASILERTGVVDRFSDVCTMIMDIPTGEYVSIDEFVEEEWDQEGFDRAYNEWEGDADEAWGASDSEM